MDKRPLFSPRPIRRPEGQKVWSGTNCGKAKEAAWKNCPQGVPEGTAQKNSKVQYFQAATNLFHSQSIFVYHIAQSGIFKNRRKKTNNTKTLSGVQTLPREQPGEIVSFPWGILSTYLHKGRAKKKLQIIQFWWIRGGVSSKVDK